MTSFELKELENQINELLKKKKEEGISWIYVDELVKEAREKLGYSDDDFPKWKWQGTNNRILFQIKNYEKIDLSDFNLEES